jgi:hypothetical protein
LVLLNPVQFVLVRFKLSVLELHPELGAL